MSFCKKYCFVFCRLTCTGPKSHYTDNDCAVKVDEDDVCFFDSDAQHSVSCATLCNGVIHWSIDERRCNGYPQCGSKCYTCVQVCFDYYRILIIIIYLLITHIYNSLMLWLQLTGVLTANCYPKINPFHLTNIKRKCPRCKNLHASANRTKSYKMSEKMEWMVT